MRGSAHQQAQCILLSVPFSKGRFFCRKHYLFEESYHEENHCPAPLPLSGSVPVRGLRQDRAQACRNGSSRRGARGADRVRRRLHDGDHEQDRRDVQEGQVVSDGKGFSHLRARPLPGGVTFPVRGKSPKAHQGTFRKVPWTFRARGPAAKRWARVQPSSRPREKPRGGFPHWILLPSLRGLYEGWGRLRLNNPAFKRQILRITSSSPPPRQGSLSEGAWLSRPRRSGLASLGAASSGAGVDGLLPRLRR